MKRFIKSFLREITSRDNWKQVGLMMGRCDPEKAIKEITKENRIPFMIASVITIILFIIIVTLLYAVIEFIKSAGPQGGRP